MAQRGLTEKQRAFARYCFSGMSQREAYRKAFPNKKLKDASCDVQASRLLKNVKVQEYLEELRQQAQSDAVLTKRARMEWLSRVVTTAPNAVDGESDLCQEMTTSEFGVKCRMPDKLRAVQELNKMDGAYTPEEVKVTTEWSFSSLLKELKISELVRWKKESGA
ncbi:terminase small subunit [Akkermansia sp.]